MSPLRNLVVALVIGVGSLALAATRMAAPIGEGPAARIETRPSCTGGDVVVAPDGTVLVTGVFAGTVDFDPGDGVDLITSRGGFDVFLTRYDAQGRHLWTKTFGGPGDDEPASLCRM